MRDESVIIACQFASPDRAYVLVYVETVDHVSTAIHQ